VSRADYIDNPTPEHSNPFPVFVRADPGAGCTWGRIVHRGKGDAIFVLTPNGTRYYGCRTEWEKNLLVIGDPEYDRVRAEWARALATLP
jgi:hypothetical protein